MGVGVHYLLGTRCGGTGCTPQPALPPRSPCSTRFVCDEAYTTPTEDEVSAEEEMMWRHNRSAASARNSRKTSVGTSVMTLVGIASYATMMTVMTTTSMMAAMQRSR